MARSMKPYRRYRARGRGGDLDDLRALTTKESAQAGADLPPRPATPPPESRPDIERRRRRREREERPAGRLDHEQRRALARDGRSIWSLRGLSAWGWIWRVLTVLFVCFLAWSGFGYMALNGAVGDSNGRVTEGARAALDPAPGGMLGNPTNTLIIGADNRRGQTRARADTLMIMRTDPDSGRIKFLSIPRDYRVDLGGVGTERINAAYYYGGQRGAILQVRKLTGIPINHIIVIRFEGLAEMVDAVGGVTVNNPTALVNCPYEAGRTVSFPQGEIRLDGARALEFSRVRKCDSDLQRALRQQAVVAGLKGQVLSFGSLWRAPWRGAGIVRAITTDIGTVDMIKLGWLQARLKQEPEDRIVLSGTPQMIGGINYVVQTDPDEAERQVASFMSSD